MYFRNILIFGVLAILFVPFIISESMLFPFITGKAFTFRIIVEILFGIWAIGMFFEANLRPKFSWIMVAVLSFLGVITLADLFGANLYRSFWSNYERMEGLVGLLHVAAYFFIASSALQTMKHWKLFFNTSIVASVIMSIYSIVQLAGGITINQGGTRVDGTLGNATYLAVFMLINFFISLFLVGRIYQEPEGKFPKWVWYALYGVAMIMQIVPLYYTATRGAILGLIGGVILAALYFAIFGKTQKLLRKISIGVLIAVILLCGGFMAIRKTNFVMSSPVLNRFGTLSVEEVSKQGRRFIWPMALKGVAENPVLGWGQENFLLVFGKYYDPRMYNQEPWFDRAHSIVLDWLVAGGVLGLLGYLALFAAIVHYILKSKNFSLVDRAILLGFLAAYFFQNLFVFDNLVSYVYFFSFLAFVHAITTEGKSAPVWMGKFFDKPLARNITASVAVLAVFSMLYGLNIKPILASRDLIQALTYGPVDPPKAYGYFEKAYDRNTFGSVETSEQLFNLMQQFDLTKFPAELKTKYVELSIRSSDGSIATLPGDARSLLLAASLRNRISDHRAALTYTEKAIQASPSKQNVWFEQGLAHLSLKDTEAALEDFKHAYDLAPDYTEARILYAIGALYNNDENLANTLLAPVPELTVLSDERVISAYAGTGRVLGAVKLLERLAVLQPDRSDIRFRVAAGYLMLGDRPKAVRMLQSIVIDFPGDKDRAEYYIKEIQAGRNP